jgi:hypothetical protein
MARRYRAAKGVGATPYLTSGYTPELTAQMRATRPGMAHLAGTGPDGATCGKCQHLGYWRKIQNATGDNIDTRHYGGCAKYFQLAGGKHGAVVPADTPACRHFQRRD